MKILLTQESSLCILGFVDGGGAIGGYLCYAMCMALAGSALIIFLYLWKKGRLDMDEEPKYRMIEDDLTEMPKE